MPKDDHSDNGGGKMSAQELKLIEKIQLVGFKLHGLSYFPVCDKTKMEQLASRREVNNIIQTVCNVDSIDLTDVAKLIAIGNGMSIAKDNYVSYDACEYINKASWDCAVYARQLLDKAGADRDQRFGLGGHTIAAGMDFYHNYGYDVCNYYKAFHNGIMAIPSGACGPTFKEVFKMVTLYKRNITANIAQLQKILCDYELKPDEHDKLQFVKFTDRDGAPIAAKRKLPNSPGLPPRKKHKDNDDTD